MADEYVLTDGGKPGLYKDLTKVFKNKQHEVHHVTMMYKRDDVKACREKTRQGSVNQIEGKLHITQAIADKPIRVGQHFGSSSDGNAIDPIRLPAWGTAESLMATFATKLALFARRRWDVGGLGRLEEAPPPKRIRFADDDQELQPVFYHTP